MRIHDSRIYAIPLCKKFQLLGNSSGRYAFAKTVEKYITRLDASLSEPLHRLGAQSLRYVETPHLAPLGIDVKIALLHMLGLDLQQFAHTGSGGGEKPHYEIPRRVASVLQTRLQKSVIGIADDILKKIFLLHLYETHFKPVFLHILQIFIDSLQP